MESVHVAVSEEIALEGLDGITLETLWFRLSVRLKLTLPLNKNFQQQIWKLVISQPCFEYFVIAEDRPTPKTLDRQDYFFDTEISDEDMKAHILTTYYIYSYCPIDDPDLRGSCKEFSTRKRLSIIEVKESTLDEISNKYHQKLVIVAHQDLRNSVLIPKNVGRDVDLNNHSYCILERIGRARYFGESTSGPFSLNDFVKDSKLLHYFRNNLLQNQLVVRQTLQATIRGKKIYGQLFHLPRFFALIRASDHLQTELLVNFLKEQPKLLGESEKVRTLLNVRPKGLASFIKQRKNIFKMELKIPYRQCYPNATKEEYSLKNKSEKKINVVRLLDPNVDLAKLLNVENETSEGSGFLDTSNQYFNRPLVHQVYRKLEETGREGMSQHEIGNHFGLTKLSARSVLRKTQRTREVTFYMKDEGRQRVSKYVTKNAAVQANKNLLDEMNKLLQKVDEASAQESPASTSSTQPSTKVSIPLSPSTLKFLKPEPEPKRAIHFQLPEQQQPEASDNQDLENADTSHMVPVFVPSEEFSFIDNVENVTISMRFLNCIPKMKKECKGITQAISESKVSQKVLTRMNMILDLIKTRTVIDCVTLLSEMRQSESNLREVICRKSMLTLCGKLLADNFLKAVQMELKSDKKTVESLFIVDPKVNFDMRCWHSIIEEQKIQHFITNNSVQEQKAVASALTSQPKISIESEELGAQSKYCEDFPKFMKLKLFHEFLFYLIYAYPDDHKKILINKAIDIWAKDNPKILEYEEITENITNCFSTEISWKMFVPPLNSQRDYQDGWALIRDVIHRIPLILFVKFTRAAQGNKELQEYLNHPIKCNYLLHFLPPKLRVNLLQGRKHVFLIQSLCKRLCWCGLLQFGPARTKEIDQSFVYLNRNTALLDTRSSDEGYLEVSAKNYPELKFQFETPDDVAEYWNQMFQIAINTPINKRNTAIGKTIEIEQSNSKPVLQVALKVQSPATAPLNDVGHIPGDRKGAAGLDKTLMVHLKQNWMRPLEGSKKKVRTVARASFNSRSTTTSSFKEPKSKFKKDKSTIVKEAATRIKNKTLKPKPTISKLSSNSKLIHKRPPVNVIRKQSMETEDTVDKAALKMMKTMRVTWSELEDKTLILTKVAAKFAFPAEAQSSHYVSQYVVRDILHWRTDQALNKTSKACSRRLQYLMKTKSSVREQIALFIEELRANREFNNKYRNLAERLKKIYPLEEIYNVVKIHIVEMVYRLHQIFYKQYLGRKIDDYKEQVYELPNDYSELVKNFTIANPADSLIEKKYFNPTNPKEAEICMLNFLVHGDVCCAQDRRKQFAEVYLKFSDTNLSAAITQLKRTNVISVSKKDRNKGFLPSTLPQFRPSGRYAAQMLNIYVPFELYKEYFQAIKTLSASDAYYQIKNVNCGWIFMLAEMMCSKKINLSFERAEKLVMVDPALRKKSQFDKISDNYLKLKNQENSSGLKKTVKTHIDERSDESFLFSDDPIEIFFKMSSVFLHTFCVLSALKRNEDIHVKSWKVEKEGECSLKSCIMKDDDSFGTKIRQIATDNHLMVKKILESSPATSLSLSSVTTQNFLMFYDEAIQKHVSEFEINNRKDFSTRSLTLWNKMTTRNVLEAILRLETEPGLEEDSWITDYKKICRKNDDDGLEDEDVDSIKHSKMFHQLRDLNVSQRTSDSFVVNLSAIFVNLDQQGQAESKFGEKKFASEVIPFTVEDRMVFLENIVNEARYKQEDLESKDLFDELSSVGIIGPLEIMQFSEICSFVQSKLQSGATSEELLDVFPDKFRLQKQIETLIKLKIIFRIGVVESVFVHKEFVAFWLIDSFYSTKSATQSQTGEICKRKSDEESGSEPATKIAKTDDGPSTSTARLDNIVETSTSKAVDQLQSENIVHKLQPEIKQDQTLRTPIRFRPSPWIRVNGSLNRQVLDKWLGSILNHLSSNPSMMLTDLITKFNVLSPFHVRNLCEILQTIGSAQLMTITESEVNLFSTHTDPIIEPATFFCESEKVFVELNDDAMHRLAFFIDHKKYKNPF